MDKYDYTIVKRGQDEDGGTWADYICTIGGKQVECQIQLMPGLDLEHEIEESVKDDVDTHERREAMTPEENARLDRIAANYRRRHPNPVPPTTSAAFVIPWDSYNGDE